MRYGIQKPRNGETKAEFEERLSRENWQIVALLIAAVFAIFHIFKFAFSSLRNLLIVAGCAGALAAIISYANK